MPSGNRAPPMGAIRDARAEASRIHPLVAASLGALSFGGWLGAIALDAKVFPHNTLGSFLVHLPLMLTPATLVLGFGLPSLPERERTTGRVAAAWTLVVLLTAPALAPQLTHLVFLLPFRLPVFGLGVAFALVDPSMRLRLSRQATRRLSPSFVAAFTFGVLVVATAFVALSLPHPQASCHGLACGALTGLVQTMICAAALWIALLALVGAALGYRLGEVVRNHWRAASLAG